MSRALVVSRKRLSATIHLPIDQRTGGLHRRKPVLSIVCHASIALCLSIRRRVCGTGGLDDTHGVRPPRFGLLATVNRHQLRS